MTPYPSIETVYVRDPVTNRLRFGENREPETALVNEWHLSEKIDGTNIRVICTLAGYEVRGRTDAANLSADLVAACVAAMPALPVLIDYFTEYRGRDLPEAWSVTFYGEGYGAGIQKGGVYSPVKRFRAFDLKLGEHSWTDDPEMRRVCGELGIETAPLVGVTYPSMERLPDRRGDLDYLFPNGSIVAFEDAGARDVQPEGIVAKPPVVLLDKHGRRVMWKLTYREFDARG